MLTIYHGTTAPLRIRGEHAERLADFAQRNPGWHSAAPDATTQRALRRLVSLDCLEVSGDQFRWKWPETITYSSWRHGGWYTSVRLPCGASGCVSRNYPDGKWRIVCDPRSNGYEFTYRNRDEAARAERDLYR